MIAFSLPVGCDASRSEAIINTTAIRRPSDETTITRTLRVVLPPQWQWYVLGALVYGGVYALNLRCFVLDHPRAVVLWLPTSLALVWLLVTPRRQLLPLVAVLAGLGWVAHGLALEWSRNALWFALLSALHPLAVQWLLQRFAPGSWRARDSQGIARFLLLLMVATAVVAVPGSILVQMLTGWSVQYQWAHWWVGNLLGEVALVTCLLAWWDQRWRRRSWRRLGEGAAVLLAVVLLVGWVFLAPASAAPAVQAGGLLLPSLLFAAVAVLALRFGLRLTAASTAVVVVAAVAASVNGHGPFAATTGGDVVALTLQLQLYLLALCLSGLLLCALLADLHQSQAELHASREQFARVFQLSPSAISISRLVDSSFIDVNQGFERMFGHRREEVVGRTSVGLGLWIDAQERAQMLADIRRDGVLYERLLHFRRQDGAAVAGLMSARSIDIGGEACLVAVIHDLTERQRLTDKLRAAADAAEAGNRAKGEFLAHMSHEIRTPMNGVMGMAELLVDSPLDPEQREIAATILTAARSLLTVINDILDLSRLEAGRLDLAKVQFAPLTVAREVQALFAHTASERGLALEVRAEEGLPAQAVGDPGRLRQVLVNLVGNAVKFTDCGSVTVAIACTATGWRFTISDTGPGLDAAAIAGLFTPFFQVGDISTRRHNGSGLGLAICKRIVDRMGGSIGVESRPGHGSAFWFVVPLAS